MSFIPKQNKLYSSSFTKRDECIEVSVSMLRGLGEYERGLFFNKKKMFNLKLNLSIDNPNNYKITNITAYLNGGGKTVVKKLSNECYSSNEIDLESSVARDNLSAKIKIDYSIGLFTRKSMEILVSKHF